MTWHKSTTFTLDCLAAMAGLLIASPFALILAVPFLGGL